jgi:UDPglucose 6-dehydrogenase
MKSIGIIGQGFVGTAVREKMREHFLVYTYDKYNKDQSLIYKSDTVIENERAINIDVLVENCDIIFVCVPTPMFEDGECDTRIVRSVIEDLAQEAESQDRNVIAVVKSTVPPGTTKGLNQISKRVGVTFSPEFLTEANSVNDFKNQKRIVLGIDWAEYINPVVEIFSISFPDADVFTINSDEAEMVKYVTNLFLATKVSFFNDMYQICQKLGINYDQVIDVTLADPRIGKSHYRVPGPDGDLGYGGHCFPKDMNAMLYIAQVLSVPVPTLAGAHTTNQIVRSNKDWERMQGRAVSKRDLDIEYIREVYPANIEGSEDFNSANQ